MTLQFGLPPLGEAVTKVAEAGRMGHLRAPHRESSRWNGERKRSRDSSSHLITAYETRRDTTARASPAVTCGVSEFERKTSEPAAQLTAAGRI